MIGSSTRAAASISSIGVCFVNHDKRDCNVVYLSDQTKMNGVQHEIWDLKIMLAGIS